MSNLSIASRSTLQVGEEAELPSLPPTPYEVSDLERAVLGVPEEPLELETYLDLSDQQLSDIPHLKGAVTHLRLDTNMLKSIDGLHLADFSLLTVLDLSFNAITEFSSVFSRLMHLRELYLNHNALGDIPDSLGCLTQLEILDLSNNQIYHISNAIGKLTALHHLDVRHNRLETLPYALGVLESRLFTLLIDNNPYTTEFKELVSPLLGNDLPAVLAPSTPKPANRWRKLRSAMRKSMSMEPSSGLDNMKRSQRVLSLDASPPVPLPNRQRNLTNPRPDDEIFDEVALMRRFKKLTSKDEAAPPIPAKNPRRFKKPVSDQDGLMERPAFDNRRCQTLDGFVFISDAGPSSPTIEQPLTPSSLKKLGFSQFNLGSHQIEPPLYPHSRRESHSSSSSSSVMSNDRPHPPITNDLLRDSGYSTDTLRSHPGDLLAEGLGGWPHMPVGGHLLPSHAKLVEFLRRLRDHWDLSPESSEASQVLLHRRQFKSISGQEEAAFETPSIGKGNEQRRRNIMAEILSTEETYVKSLQALVDIYIKGAQQRQLFSPEEERALFGNVQSILLFHHQYLLPEIKREMSTSDPCLGEVFAAHSAYLKMYSLYVNDFDIANHEAEKLQSMGSTSGGVVGSAARHRKKIKNYLEACVAHPSHNQLNLQGFLLLPVQRIPRYRLLLQDLLKCTPLDHPDREGLVRAYGEVARRADEINERKRVKEANDKVIEIQNRIKGQNQVPLVEPHRRFIKEGPLHLRQIVSLRHNTIPGHVASFAAPPRNSSLGETPKSPNLPPPPSRLVLSTLEVKIDFMYVLFNDIMIQCKPSGKDELEINRVFELGSKLKPARLVNAKVLRVVDNRTIYYFMGPTEEVNTAFDCL
ncbi:hypothetical protein DSO57_1016025 [Entomophthora muscae]|uniref:Uncharacterized protein n=1 Tax=Entomophthora muscae TaxID=34485 RepID=A0ACC2UDV8_9FUNG|nr:hypothetical protein DSO57_1016025 [Entomophthora muscae]